MSKFREIIRKTNSKIRQELSADVVKRCSAKVCSQIKQLTQYRYAKNLALYMASDNEIDLSAIWKCAPFHGKQCYFPAINDDGKLDFLPANPKTPFINNKFTIKEPDVKRSKAQSPDNISIIFMPLVAFDSYGMRIGRGAGYYDKSLEDYSNPLLIGVAYEFQKELFIEAEPWDKRLSMIITEDNIYRSKN